MFSNTWLGNNVCPNAPQTQRLKKTNKTQVSMMHMTAFSKEKETQKRKYV